MKPVIREYLASLKERQELDAVIPDLLSELGYTVFSRPSRGTRQFGVDVAAVGPTGDDRVYLFSIKSGDLTRSEWNGKSDQALRWSLDEILDAYIPNHLPPEYSSKPIVICPCFGGEVVEAAHEAFYGYMKTKATDRVGFEVWNGDRLAGYIEQGLLREGLLSEEMRSSLRKAIAMSDEPDVSFTHFKNLVDAVVAAAMQGPDAKRLTAARQLSIGLWMLFGWSRDGGNLESPYLASEYLLLMVWPLAKELLANGTKASEDMGMVLSELVDLHMDVWEEFIGKKVLPHTGRLHALSAAVRTASPLDVNLKLFDILGRIALHGLWLLWLDGRSGNLPAGAPPRDRFGRIRKLADQLCGFVDSNPALLTPIADDQVIDLALGFMFLAAEGGHWSVLQSWVAEIVKRADFAYRIRGRFPCSLRDYAELADHPKTAEGYFGDVTEASVLLPTLAFWAAALGDDRTLEVLSRLKQQVLSHCSFQLWMPDQDSEAELWGGPHSHGGTLFNVPIVPEAKPIMEYVLRECSSEAAFHKLSAVEEGFWPLVLVACRHHRLPVPPQFWSGLMPWLPDPLATGFTIERFFSSKRRWLFGASSHDAIAAGLRT